MTHLMCVAVAAWRARAITHSNITKTDTKFVIATKPVANHEADPAIGPGCDPKADEHSDSNSGSAAEDLTDVEVEVESVEPYDEDKHGSLPDVDVDFDYRFPL